MRALWVLFLVGCGGVDEGPVGVNEVGGDWLEIYNGLDEAASIEGWSFTTAGDELVIASVVSVPAGGVVTVEFTVPMSGDTLTVADASGSIVQVIEVPELASASSFGRIPDGIANWQILGEPSPGALNVPSTSAQGF